ncbi:unnamed protein product, partial [Pleuronectes platessa]
MLIPGLNLTKVSMSMETSKQTHRPEDEEVLTNQAYDASGLIEPCALLRLLLWELLYAEAMRTEGPRSPTMPASDNQDEMSDEREEVYKRQGGWEGGGAKGRQRGGDGVCGK